LKIKLSPRENNNFVWKKIIYVKFCIFINLTELIFYQIRFKRF